MSTVEDFMSVPPQPVPDVDTAPYWAATAEGGLSLCRCTSCRAWLHPPLERCRYCAAPTGFEAISGAGTITGCIVMHRVSVPGQGTEPYAIVLVDLVDAPRIRLTGRLAADPAEAAVGRAVTARIVEIPGGPFHQAEFVLAD
jgi:uncharacterized OB-fold protein